MPAKPPATTLPAFTPVPRKCQRHDGWTPERQHGFIEALADYGSVRAAANSVGMTPESAYYLRRQQGAASFRKAWEAALDHGVKRIEDTAMDRALNGVEVPVYSYGKLVGTRTVFNDRLLMFMLRNRAPKRFAADGAKGLSGLDKHRLARMKKEWRAEWEREVVERKRRERKDILASLETKLERMHRRREAARQREEEAMSAETRRLKATYEESLERDKRRPPALPADTDAVTGPSEEMKRYLPGWREKPKVADTGPRVRSIKDDGWD
ncbi:hypothetical protein [Erythrobacter sp. EC-HK427]|uniref:hypothetical protein n=1 Tax=Erythrobacter sp. EC-HK427 TaxID=2038396 RepID=UPI001250E94B|nr:hypothetical protein [Erythrobacter sp. EC-HK427]VVT13793.1 conserved hypothetical protein [Erythrobacter sp. EC-HK427]